MILVRESKLTISYLIFKLRMLCRIFLWIVKPNEKLSLHVNKINQVKNAYKFSGFAKVNNKVVTEAVFTAIII